MKQEIERKENLEIVSQKSFDTLTEKFLTSLEVTDSSKSTYRRQLRQFFSWLQDRSDLTAQTFVEYKNALLNEKKLTPLTVAGYLTAVRKFFSWLESEKIYPNIAKVKSPKKPRGYRKDCLSKEQIRSSLATINRTAEKGLRDYAVFNLLVRTGLRTIEVARATIGDIRQESGQAVLYIQGKGRNEKDDFVLLTEEALTPIRDYLRAREQNGKLFDDDPLFSSESNRNGGQAMTTRSLSRIVKNALRSSGNDSKRLSAHSLRHTAITLSIAGGASLQQVQSMARHADPKTTMVYLHNIERVKAGAEKYISF